MSLPCTLDTLDTIAVVLGVQSCGAMLVELTTVLSACSSVEADTEEDESILQGREEVERRLRSVDSLLTEAAKYLPVSRVQVSILTIHLWWWSCFTSEILHVPVSWA